MKKPIDWNEEERVELARLQELSPFELLCNWMSQRERVRLAKAAGQQPPWTCDPVLRHYRFCNVRRMDDKVSNWLLENWYLPYYNHKNALIACVLARQFNKIETLEAIGFPEVWRPHRVHAVVQKRMLLGPVYSAAYVITGTLSKEKKPHQSIYSVVDVIHKAKPLVNTSSMKDTADMLMTFRGISSFTAGQIVSDLRHAIDGTWADRMEWAPVGPGSRRGMNRLLGRELLAPMRQSEFGELLQALIENLGSKDMDSITDRMEAMDYQSCLCEYDKYCRVVHASGKFPKQKYQGF